MIFDWWWDKEAEEKDAPEPWETFEVRLYGREAGDFASTAITDRILYEIAQEGLRVQPTRIEPQVYVVSENPLVIEQLTLDNIALKNKVKAQRCVLSEALEAQRKGEWALVDALLNEALK